MQDAMVTTALSLPGYKIVRTLGGLRRRRGSPGCISWERPSIDAGDTRRYCPSFGKSVRSSFSWLLLRWNRSQYSA